MCPVAVAQEFEDPSGALFRVVDEEAGLAVQYLQLDTTAPATYRGSSFPESFRHREAETLP